VQTFYHRFGYINLFLKPGKNNPLLITFSENNESCQLIKAAIEGKPGH
jgi:hypothetical protein